MVPDVAKVGHSFKGAFAYYLQDKRQDGETAQPQTAERVAWTDTRNLATDDPALAKRIMIATADQADALKARAGIKNTGRKSNAHVYAYSLAWHPDEAGKLDRAEMLRAVDQTLKVLGAENHQAVIVCHQDQKHPHVHVILNRVDPASGKMLSTSNDRLKLSDWANAYERERGQIVTPKREEKRQMREQFADKAARQDYAAEQRQAAQQRAAPEKSAGALLKELQEAQKARHRQEWKDLAAANKLARGQIYTAYSERMKKAAAVHKDECKPIWAAHFRQERKERRAFERRERSLSGVIANAMRATTQQKISDQLGKRGVLSATFNNIFSSQARAAAFAAAQEMSRGELHMQLKAVLDREMTGLRDRRAAALVKQRGQFETARADLIERQNGEKAKIREAWRQHYERKADRQRGDDRAFADRARKPYWKAPEKSAPAPYKRLAPSPETRINRLAGIEARARKKTERAAIGQAGAEKRRRVAVAVEPQPVKRDFDNVRQSAVEPPKAQTAPAYVARPAPAPSPSGEAPTPPKRELREVPQPERETPRTPLPAKDWDATTKPKPSPDMLRKDWNAPAFSQQIASEVAPKDWSKDATPSTEPVEMRKDWSECAFEQERAISRPQPMPDRSRDRDDGPERN